MNTRVLIIEDNQANLDLITYLLEAYSYRVDAAREGKSGLAAARRERPDIILCDIQMPGMDGFEVIDRLRRDPQLHSIKTVALTAYAMVGDREKLLAAGFDGYLPSRSGPRASSTSCRPSCRSPRLTWGGLLLLLLVNQWPPRRRAARSCWWTTPAPTPSS